MLQIVKINTGIYIQITMHMDMSMARVRLQGTGQTAFGTRQLAPDACAVRGAAAARARCGTLGQAWHNRRQPAPTPPRHATPSTAAPLIRLPSASTRGCSLVCLALPVDQACHGAHERSLCRPSYVRTVRPKGYHERSSLLLSLLPLPFLCDPPQKMRVSVE